MGLVRTLYIHTERTFRPFAVGITGNPRFILSHKHNVVVLGILINQSFLIELLNQFFRDVSLTEIGHRSCNISISWRKSEIFRRSCDAVVCRCFSNQQRHCFRKGFPKELHYKFNRVASFALAMAEPFVSLNGQTVMPFPSVLVSAFCDLLTV